MPSNALETFMLWPSSLSCQDSAVISLEACDVSSLVLWHANERPQVSSIHHASGLSTIVSSVILQY